MSQSIKNLLRTTVGFLLAAVFLYLAFRGTDFGDLWSSLRGADYVWVSLLIPITLISHWFRAVRWSYLLAPVKRSLSTHNLFGAVMIGFMVNNVLPRVGEIVRAYAIGRSEGISKSSAFGTVVIERILDMLTFLFVLSVVLFIYPHSLDPFVENVDAVRPLFLAGSILSVGLFIILFLKSASLFRLMGLVRPLVPRRYREKFERALEAFLSGFGVAQMREKFIVIILLSLLMWGAYGMILYVTFFALEPIAARGLGFGAALVLLTISTFAWALPAPGAWGTYHSFLTVALVKLYGVDSITALSFTIITHEAGFIITTIVGLIYFLKDHLKVSLVGREAFGEATDKGAV